MKQARIDLIKAKIDIVGRRYNPENDTIPGAPIVTWADSYILDIISVMANVIETQQATIERHEALIDRLFGNIEQMSRR